MADSSDQISVLTDNNKDLEVERARLEADNALLVEQVETSDRSKVEHSRYSLLMTLFATTLAAGVSFDLIGSHYDASVSDKMTTISELEYELKETKRDHMLEKLHSEELYRKIKQIDAQKAQINKQQNQKSRKVCMMASSCTYDRKGDNYITCSVYKGVDRFQCTYTVESRVERVSYCNNQINLSDGRVKYNCNGWKSYKIVKFEAE